MKKKLSIIILLFFLIGCASQTSVKPDSLFQIKEVKSVSVIVDTIIPSSEKEIEAIEQKLIEKLREANIFSKVSIKNQKSDLIIKVQIEELVKVSKSDRFWFGSLAGRAKVAGKVTLIESFSGKVLVSFDLEAISSGGTIFAGTTEQAIDNFVEKLTDFILTHVVI